MMAQKKRLPIGYTEIRWIETSGENYINTGFLPNRSSTKVKIALSIESKKNGAKGLFGCRKSFNIDSCNIFLINGKDFRLDWINPERSCPFEYQAIHDFEILDNIAIINGNIYKGDVHENTYTAYPFYIGTFNDKGTPYKSLPAKFYYCELYDNGHKVRDYIPCISPSGETGMYDLVNDKFYVPQGIGIFNPGPIA